MQLQSHTVTDERGVERCQVIKETAIPNVPNDPSKGYHIAKAYCNQPMALSVSEKRKICPSCYKEPVVGYPTPRTTNAAGVVLTKKELEECGITGEDPSTQPSAPKKAIEAPQAVEAKVEVKKDEVVLSIPLMDLESNADVAAYLIQKVLAGFGSLPVTNYAESKRLMKLEEKLESMLGA